MEEPGEQCNVVFALFVKEVGDNGGGGGGLQKTTVHFSPGFFMVCALFGVNRSILK